MSINERVKEVRVHLKFNQKDFSNELGFKQSYYSEVESGKRKVTSRLIESLLTKYKISSEWLYTGNSEMFITNSDNKNKPQNVNIDYTFSKIKSSKLYSLETFLKLNEKELDNEIMIENQKLRSIFEDYTRLLDTLHNMKNSPIGKLPILNRLFDKFPIWDKSYDEYLKGCYDDFEYLNGSNKNDLKYKVKELFDVYYNSQDHLQFLLSKLISFMHSCFKQFDIPVD